MGWQEITVRSEYEPRAIRFLDKWVMAGFRLKVYGIAFRKEKPSGAMLESARRLALERLQESAAGTDHYGVGFVGVHEGRDGHFIFVDWWANENELFHHVYVATEDAPTDFRYKTPTGLTACVWDLRLLAFEREAWIEHVLEKPDAPDLDGYLAARLSTDA